MNCSASAPILHILMVLVVHILTTVITCSRSRSLIHPYRKALSKCTHIILVGSEVCRKYIDWLPVVFRDKRHLLSAKSRGNAATNGLRPVEARNQMT